jgi:putative chitinase
MATNSQLTQWRRLAAQRLRDLIVSKLTAPELNDLDDLIDNLLRSLSGQDPRLVGRNPYQGILPGDLPLPQLRERAANGVKVYIENMKSAGFTPEDETVDTLVRKLSGFGGRPIGVQPYEGIFPLPQDITQMQIDTWRKQAAALMSSLVANIPDPALSVKDELADGLLRALSGQAARPSGQPAYTGLFPAGNPVDSRKRAAAGIKVFIEHIKDPRLASKDAVIDALIRRFRGLPERPAGRLPFDGLFPRIKLGLVTEQHLRAVAPNGSLYQIRKFVEPLNITMAEFQINTPLRQAHFLAQLAHESGEFNYVEEIASGAAYEGRSDLGNTQPGDGVRFKGRGLIQITGRANYQDCGRALGVDLIGNPTLLSRDDLAARSAGWFWNRAGLNAVADRDDARQVTRIINGGYNGLDDRLQKLAAAKRAFGV